MLRQIVGVQFVSNSSRPASMHEKGFGDVRCFSRAGERERSKSRSLDSKWLENEFEKNVRGNLRVVVVALVVAASPFFIIPSSAGRMEVASSLLARVDSRGEVGAHRKRCTSGLEVAHKIKLASGCRIAEWAGRAQGKI